MKDAKEFREIFGRSYVGYYPLLIFELKYCQF